MRYVPLYIQSEYDMLHSTISLKSLFGVAKSYGFNAMAITDRNMHGTIKFYRLCKEHQLQPIIGLRCYVEINETITCLLLYATSSLGYHNLMKIATQQAMNNCVTWEQLAKHTLDVLAIIPGDENEVVSWLYHQANDQAALCLARYRAIFSMLYLGVDLQTNQAQNQIKNIMQFCKQHQIKAVALQKSLFLHDDDFDAYCVLRGIDLGSAYQEPTEKEKHSVLLSGEEAELVFQSYPELLETTNEIAALCHIEISFGTYHLPSFGHPNSSQYLLDLCKLGLNKRLKGQKVDFNIYKKRLFYELDVIRSMGFCDYFLIVYDFVRFAKQSDILVGPGRGSAPGSLVSYVLGITDIDPIAYHLLFERFLNPERISMPDIDVDFPDDKRDLVIQYVGKRYGKMRVAHITTFGTFGARLALRDVARIIQYSELRLAAVLKEFPSYPVQPIKEVIERSLELQAMMKTDDATNRLLSLAIKIEGLPRHTSTHAAGIIMADQDLIEYTPLQKGMNEIFQTQYEASDLESLGLLKMDILGLRNLTIMKQVIEQVAQTQNKRIDITKIPLNDSLVYQMIAKGDTDGIFQLESRGMRNVLRDLKASEFMDIVHANALYRPGPMEMIPIFVKRKFGEDINYLHEDLKEILKPTYGTIVFQEQIMLIAQRFAGYSLGMADILRRAVSKKNHEILENERKRFITHAMKRGYSETLSNDVYDYIVKFANYGFNKNHAVAYSMIAYQMGYLKVHYYPYFMAVLMTNSLGSMRLIQAYVRDCKKKSIFVMPPDINISSQRFEALDKKIYFSLLAVNNVGNVIVESILEERKKALFKNYEDFVFRCASFINKRIVSSLIHAGAFDGFKLTRKHMIDSFDQLIQKQSYFHILCDRIVDVSSSEEFGFFEAAQLEKEALGFNLRFNLFLPHQELKKEKRCVNIIDLKPNWQGYVLLAIRSVREITTKKGDAMAFLDVYDDTDSIDAVAFPQTYTRIKSMLEMGVVYLTQVRVDKRDEKLQLIIENVYTVK